VARLPDRLRAAVVACDLEGLGHEQAARRLGWPVGTVKSRQARGRQRLRARLAGRGLASVPLPVVLMPGRSGAVALPDGLARGTVRLAFASGGGVRLAGMVPAAVELMVRSEVGTMAMISKASAVGVILLGASAVVLAARGGGGPGGGPGPLARPVESQQVGGQERRNRDRPLMPPAPIELEAVPIAGETLVAARDEEGELLPPQGETDGIRVDYETKPRPLSLVAVVGVFNQGALQEAIRGPGAGGAGRVVVGYRRVDLQRQRLGEDGEWSPWVMVDPEETREFVQDVAFQMEEWTPEALRHEVLVSWVPFLQGWRDDESRLIAGRFRERRLSDKQFWTGVGMVGRAEGTLPPHVREPWLMIRAVDLTPEPGETYRYRVRVVIEDPRSGLPGKREVAGEWSEPIGPVLAAGVADPDGGAATEGRAEVRSPLPPAPTALNPVPLAGMMPKQARDERGGLLLNEDGAARMVEVPVSLIAVVGEFDQGAYQAVLRESGLVDAGPVDIPYRRVDLQRQQLEADGSWSDWVGINREARREEFRDVKFWSGERTRAEVRPRELVDAIPFLSVLPEELDAARFPEAPPTEAAGVPDGGGPLGSLPEPEEQVRPRHVGERFLMIRATDLWVVPSETYRYRARVVIQDPRPLSSGRRELPGAWSEPTAPVEAAAMPDRGDEEAGGDAPGV
jgi:hypothetical protein